jgi:hypothetical protein
MSTTQKRTYERMSPIHSEIEQQRRCLRLIGDLLVRTERKDLPQLAWRIAHTGGSVTAQADWPGRERAVFDAWARELNLKVDAERAWEFGGTTHLRAEGEVGGVYVFLRAALPDPCGGVTEETG